MAGFIPRWPLSPHWKVKVLAVNKYCGSAHAGEMEETLIPRSGIELETIQGGAIVGVPLHVSCSQCSKACRERRESIRFDSPLSAGCHVYDRWLYVPACRTCCQIACAFPSEYSCQILSLDQVSRRFCLLRRR